MTGIRRITQSRFLLGIVGIVGFAALFLAIASYLPQRLLAPGGQTISAVVANSMQLSKGDPVRIDGVRAGEVTGLELASDGRSTRIEMKIFKEGQPVYRDAKLWIRWRTLVGALFAVDLDRGTATAGELGDGIIPRAQTVSQVELEDLARVVRGDAQAGLRTGTGELGEGLADTDAPKAALEALTDVAPNLDGGIDALRGRREGDLRRLVRNTAATVQALDQPPAVESVVEGAGTTLSITARRAPEVRRTLRAGATSLPNARAALTSLRGTLHRLDPVVDELDDSAPDVAPTLRALNPTLTSADRLLADAQPLLRALRPATRSLARAARKGVPLVEGLTPSLQRLEREILPDLALKSPSTKRATYEMIGPAIAGLLAPFSYFDNETYFVRFLASGGEKAVDSAPCTSFVTDPTRRDEQLVTCAKAEALIQSIFNPPASMPKLRKKP